MSFQDNLNAKLDEISKDYVWLCYELRYIALPTLLPQTCLRWVRGLSVPGARTMALIAQVLDMPTDALCGTTRAPGGAEGKCND